MLCVQTGSGAHTASCPMGTGGPFPGGKARPGRDADHSPQYSAEVVNEYELYLLSPQAPPWRVMGLLFTLLIYNQLILGGVYSLLHIQHITILYLVIYGGFLGEEQEKCSL
jgi:hypothetical protein